MQFKRSATALRHSFLAIPRCWKHYAPSNIPLSLGVPALSMGAGGEGGGAHTKSEWYSAKDREVGLKRVLLLTLATTEWAAEQ